MPIYNRIEYKKGELREHYREKSEKIVAPLYTPSVYERKNIDRFSTLHSHEGSF